MDNSNFAAWLQLFVTAFGGLVLITIWYEFKTKRVYKSSEKHSTFNALIWLSMGLYTWTLAAIWILSMNSENPLFLVVLLFTSAVNNYFFLGAVFYLDYRPAIIFKGIFSIPTNWYLVIFIVSIGTFMLGAGLCLAGKGKYEDYAGYVDLPLSLIMLCLLGKALYNSFKSRQLRTFARITSITFWFVIVTQIVRNFTSLKEAEDSVLIVSGVSKFAMITIFLVLVVSRMVEIVEEKEEIGTGLVFFVTRGKSFKVQLTILKLGIFEEKFSISDVDLATLLHFAVDRICKKEKSWLHPRDLILEETKGRSDIRGGARISHLCSSLKIEKEDLFKNGPKGTYQMKIANKIRIPQSIEQYPMYEYYIERLKNESNYFSSP